MKKIRFLYRLLSAFLDRHKKIFFLGFTTGICSFFFLPKLIPLLPKTKAAVRIGMVGRFKIDEIPLEIQDSISLGLTKTDINGNSLPALADNWSVDESGKNYVFTLGDHFWQNSTKVLASDINYNFKDVETKVLDTQKIQYTLKEPFAAFPIIVSKPIFKKGFMGVGNYKVNHITKNGQYLELISLESINNQKPDLKYRFYPSDASIKTAYKLGEINQISGLIDLSGFENWKNIQISPNVHYNQFVGIFFNTAKPPFSDKSFRQSLAYALKKDYGNLKVYGPINPQSWAYNSDVKTYDYDLANAKKLLAKSLGDQKISSVRIKIVTLSSLLKEAESVKQSWEALGLKVEIGAFSSLDNDFDALLAIQEIPDDPDQYNLWHSSQDSNITHFNNPRIDKLLEDGRKTMDKNIRKNIYFDFQRYLAEEIPVIFLYYPTTYNISRK
ncbi:hypothetical protein COT44_02520 [Candidatus Shapirobacteria bacterium CG08_land_8_20_14_0_20_39_18]|uniref:Solute-binding protein family 5 domain-containing protein n=1 Tax=Candidatus Shapirobacteria bacterium CG08_land_8_20_14_0_20_39_18 TaxID=1974883 RepID=A0A2M6XD63_9BACT|nr:MAG: hypothetical protein COT44_02520 [Candidatus Shapirobacteria bacterium CG08_land_8_20_14_0_20_39_18]PIY65271.1 MAG: hypothetical protein COY91_02540 [Candidatus Shapirobacteria bacterium CG_4_10_14_0_8_um_filter_39_15]